MRRKFLAILLIIVVTLGSVAVLFYYSMEGDNVITYTSTPDSHRFVSEYPLQNSEAAPNAIAVDSNGNVWFVLENQTSLAELIPLNGTIHQFHLPESNNIGTTCWGIAIDNTRHLVWFTDQVSNSIWRFDTADQVFAKFPLKTAEAFPYDIVLDNFGNAWFTEVFGGKIGEVSINGTVKEIPIPLSPGTSSGSGITVDKRTNEIWFNVMQSVNFTNITYFVASYSDGSFKFYNLTGSAVSPNGIIMDSSGNLWITQHGPSFVTEFNPSKGYFRTISTSAPPPPLTSSLPYFVRTDSSGNIWINEHYGNAIAEFDPSTNSLLEYEIPTKPSFTGNISGDLTMNIDPSGTPWFTEFFAGKVGSVTAAGSTVDLRLSVSNGTVILQNNTSTTIRLNVSTNNSEPVTLRFYVGNFSDDYNFQTGFSPSSGNGNFSSNLMIRDKGSPRGVYFVTISAVTQDLVFSKIIELKTT